MRGGDTHGPLAKAFPRHLRWRRDGLQCNSGYVTPGSPVAMFRAQLRRWVILCCGDASGRRNDVVGIGFGPSSLPLAIALEEHRVNFSERPVTAAFFERQPSFGWHRSMLLPSTTMQVTCHVGRGEGPDAEELRWTTGHCPPPSSPATLPSEPRALLKRSFRRACSRSSSASRGSASTTTSSTSAATRFSPPGPSAGSVRC